MYVYVSYGDSMAEMLCYLETFKLNQNFTLCSMPKCGNFFSCMIDKIIYVEGNHGTYL